MSRRRDIWIAFLALAVAALSVTGAGGAAIAPPWCGTPEPDAAANLPDGTNPADPVGSFPHIPYYAVGCTLDSIAAQSNGRMTVNVIGQLALGRDMYLVTINALDTPQQRQDSQVWQEIRRIAQTDPARGQALLERHGEDVKVPVFIQAGFTATSTRESMRRCNSSSGSPRRPTAPTRKSTRFSTTRSSVFNVIQNSDGRIAGTRT